MSRVSKLLLILSISLILPSLAKAADEAAFDEQLAAKYGLKIPPVGGQLKPAPQWVREADIVASSTAVWKGYEFLLEPTPVMRIVGS